MAVCSQACIDEMNMFLSGNKVAKKKEISATTLTFGNTCPNKPDHLIFPYFDQMETENAKVGGHRISGIFAFRQ